ncbi:AfsR/SARP family transcriptional regulator [Ovoidimarina sediminis]|uniref:AfsR/SARP family transcriptional regulator n=1 Tax=Ovoidimarina sediminis TaxID=3079856 RepID=UPI0029066ADB|nr:hypothetical protein [Rhodophyticola sp. MJ-SS7]MDU8943537.1 hypothetical protein [Rhodophyticola sp. MJ-SS7]
MTDQDTPDQGDPAIQLLTGRDLTFTGPAAQTRINGKMQRALFVALALDAGRELSRDWLADLLWSDTDQATARKRLRMTILNLRRSLADRPEMRIAGSAETLLLDIDPADVDLLRLLSRGETDDMQTRLRTTELYKGDLLPQFPEISDVFDSYLSERRAAARSHCLVLLHSILRDATEGRNERVFGQAFGAATSLDPGDETTVELGMRFWAGLGKPDHVNQVFQGHATHVRGVLDADVSADVASLRDSLMDAAEIAQVRRNRVALREAQPNPDHPFPAMDHATLAGPKTGLRSRQIAWITTAIAIAVALVVFAVSPKPAPGPVFLIRQAVSEYPPCDSAEQVNRHEATLLEALERIEDGTILIGRLRSPFVRSNVGVFIVEHSISCSTAGVRSTITVHERGTRTVLVSLRIDATSADAVELRNAIATHLPGQT